MFDLFLGSYYLFGINVIGAAYVISGYLILVFGAIILGRENFSWIGYSYFICSIPIAIWLLFLAAVILARRASTAMTLSMFLPLGFIPPIPFFYHALTIGLKKYDRRKTVVLVCWVLGLLFTLLGVFTEFIVTDIQRFPWGFYPEYSTTAYVVSAYMTVVLGIILLELWDELLESPDDSRQRAILMRLMVGVCLTGLMILDALPAYGFNVPPFGFVFALTALGFFAHTITNFSLDPISPEFAAGEILSTMRDAMVVTDREGSIRMVNEAVTEVLGYSENELEDRSLEWLTSGEVRHEEVSGREMEIESGSGKTVPISLTSSRLEGWGGNLHGWVVVFRDISERKEAQQKLRESEQRFRQMAENIDDVFWLYDLDDEEFLYWSPGFEDMFGLPRSKAPETTQDWNEMVRQVDSRQSVDSIESFLKANREFTINYQIEGDGDPRWIKDIGVPIRNDDGEFYRVAGVARDVTEIREKNAMIKEKNRELEQFAYAASHDLQQPLRQLKTFCESAQDDLDDGNTEALQQDIRDIQESARKMEELIQALMQLSRAGRDALEIEQVDLNECVEEAVEFHSEEIQETSATVETKGPLPTVKGDRALLQQVLQNLIGNALKYNSGRPEVEIVCRDREDETVVGIRDNGIGIADEEEKRIFRPFEQLHGGDDYEGTGIGLGICKKIVERHGGRIWVDSKWTDGTSVKFSLPDNPGSIEESSIESPVEDIRIH